MPFKLSLVADVRQWLKGTQDVEQSLDGLSGSLDKLAEDTQRSAQEASDHLERKFKDAFDEVKTQARTSGRKVGDEMSDGTRRAGDGFDTLKEEAHSTAREALASFDGSAESIGGAFQEVAATAFEGFGPAGMIAGGAAAAGLGIAITALQNAKQAADDYLAKVQGMAEAMRQAGSAAAGLADNIAQSMTDTVDAKEWWEVWQKAPMDRLTSWSASVRELGLTYDDVFKASTGDVEAYDRVHAQAMANITQANEQQTATFLDSLKQQGQVANDAKQWNEEYANSTVESQKRAADAAAQASQTFSDNLTNHLSVADEGLKQFVHKGKLNLAEWTAELKRRAAETQAVEDFTVTIAPKLSEEALENFSKLPTETQSQIAKAYKDGSKKDRAKIVANLEAEAKVTSVTIDASGAKSKPVEVPTKVDSSGVTQGMKKAADDAQAEANKASNVIEVKTRVDVHDLQSQVNRAAASITAPTIYVNVKAKKEVP